MRFFKVTFIHQQVPEVNEVSYYFSAFPERKKLLKLIRTNQSGAWPDKFNDAYQDMASSLYTKITGQHWNLCTSRASNFYDLGSSSWSAKWKGKPFLSKLLVTIKVDFLKTDD